MLSYTDVYVVVPLLLCMLFVAMCTVQTHHESLSITTQIM